MTLVTQKSRFPDEDGGNALVSLSIIGDVSFDSADEFESAVSSAIENATKLVALDFASTVVVDSTGISVIISQAQVCMQQKKELCIVGPSPYLRSLLDMLDVNRFCKIFDGEAAMHSYLMTLLD